jgi:hypothetical protein
VGAYSEDWCPHLLNRLVPGKLVLVDCKWVSTVRIVVLIFSTGWCLSSWYLKFFKWVLTMGIGVPHRFKPVNNVTLV